MPTKPPRPCRWPTCPRVTRDGSGYCEDHKRQENARRNARRSSSVRYRVDKRDGGRCVICGSTDGVQKHHVVPLSHGGADSEENVVTLCRLHHGAAHQKRSG